MADKEKKVEDGNTKVWISREWKELSLFFMKLKAFFIVFEGLSFGEKIKNGGHKL